MNTTVASLAVTVELLHTGEGSRRDCQRVSVVSESDVILIKSIVADVSESVAVVSVSVAVVS